MKRRFKDEIMNRRGINIIEFIKKNPFCTKDKIFSKGNIPKSKATNQLIEDLVSQQRIKSTSMKKRRFYVDEIDFLTRLEILAKDYESENRKNPYNLADKIAANFLRYRTKVLRVEQRFESKLQLKETIANLEALLKYYQNPNEINFGRLLLIARDVINDRYYLNHQLKSQPKNIHQDFQKMKLRYSRRSLPELLKMRKKKGYGYGLSKKDYEANMKKLEDPMEIIRRFDAEKQRTLYPETLYRMPEIMQEVYKMLKKSKKQEDVPKPKKNETRASTQLEKLNKNAMVELTRIMEILV